jgi:hypothetical protein
MLELSVGRSAEVVFEGVTWAGKYPVVNTTRRGVNRESRGLKSVLA